MFCFNKIFIVLKGSFMMCAKSNCVCSLCVLWNVLSTDKLHHQTDSILAKPKIMLAGLRKCDSYFKHSLETGYTISSITKQRGG